MCSFYDIYKLFLRKTIDKALAYDSKNFIDDKPFRCMLHRRNLPNIKRGCIFIPSYTVSFMCSLMKFSDLLIMFPFFFYSTSKINNNTPYLIFNIANKF